MVKYSIEGGACLGIYTKLEKLMEINDLSATDLSKLSNVPVSTIYSMKKRESNKTDLDALNSIASVFGVNINYFVSDNPLEFLKLSEQEAKLILNYRLLDYYGEQSVDAILTCQLQRIQKENEIG